METRSSVRRHSAILIVLLLTTACAKTGALRRSIVSDAELTGGIELVDEGAVIDGFRATALYTDDRDQPMGARFVHEHSGFTLALLRIDTAPQGYVWVNSAPSSDKGLPHTQEHLLLGKGNKGRHVSGVESMSMVDSSAFTANLHTAYHGRTTAGIDVFFDVFEQQLDAYLHPDYTDEEIRREVHHFGVVGEPGDLRLEEKGTVYNEMVSSYNKPNSRIWFARQATLYGKHHPKALSSGGTPEAIRTVTPEDIREFHRSHYQLGNMGVIAVLPSELTLRDSLQRFDALLRRLQPEPTETEFDTSLPAPDPAPAGSVVVTEHPSSDPNESISISFAWPPSLDLRSEESLLLDLFLSTLAGDVSTNLYKRLIDSETRRIDVDARSVWSWQPGDAGFPITIGLSGIAAPELTNDVVNELRRQVLDELATVASWPAGHPELIAFNERLLTSVTSVERSARAYLNEPPGFGSRGLGSGWFDHLQNLQRTPGFTKSLASGPEIAWVRKELGRDANVWTEHLKSWGVLSTVPYTFYSLPSSQLQDAIRAGVEERAQAEARRLAREHGTGDTQQAIARFAAEYDAATRELESLEQRELPRFLDQPPLTLDDFIDYREHSVAGTDVPMVSSIFPSMTGASVSLALRLDGVKEEDLVFLSSLPLLMRSVGVLEDGQAIPQEEVVQRLRREVRSASVWTSSNPRTGRHELVAGGQGTTPEEATLALGWAARFLHEADWRAENLPRIRDVLDQQLDQLRLRMKGREEYWVRNPKSAYHWQQDRVYLSLESFLTARHETLRLRWMFRESTDDAVSQVLHSLARAPEQFGRTELAALTAACQGRDADVPREAASLIARVEALDEAGRELVAEAARDLEAELTGLPDSSLAADWRYLCERVSADLATSPEDALARLSALRDGLMRTGGARVWAIGSEPTLESVRPALRGPARTARRGES